MSQDLVMGFIASRAAPYSIHPPRRKLSPAIGAQSIYSGDNFTTGLGIETLRYRSGTVQYRRSNPNPCRNAVDVRPPMFSRETQN